MRKILLILTSIFILTFSFVNPVLAHILKTDGTIGAVMHINPLDDPIVGETSQIFFEFKDKENKFNPKDCKCTLSVLKQGNQVFSDALVSEEGNPNSASVSYVFPEKNVYQLKITGVPLSQDSFQSFTLTYDIRVSKENSNSSQKKLPNYSNLVYTSVGIVIVGFLIFMVLKRRGGDNK